jgi:hypothetical protein
MIMRGYVAIADIREQLCKAKMISLSRRSGRVQA